MACTYEGPLISGRGNQGAFSVWVWDVYDVWLGGILFLRNFRGGVRDVFDEAFFKKLLPRLAGTRSR